MEIFIIFFFSPRLFIIFFFYYTSFDYWFCVRTRRDGLLNVVRISKASIPPLCWKLNNNLSLSSREKKYMIVNNFRVISVLNRCVRRSKSGIIKFSSSTQKKTCSIRSHIQIKFQSIVGEHSASLFQ